MSTVYYCTCARCGIVVVDLDCVSTVIGLFFSAYVPKKKYGTVVVVVDRANINQQSVFHHPSLYFLGASLLGHTSAVQQYIRLYGGRIKGGTVSFFAVVQVTFLSCLPASTQNLTLGPR